MSPQLQKAARYILENPQEAALVSMRELSRHAGVNPATMTRLAKFLGLAGYDDIRAYHAEAIRVGADGFAARARQRNETDQNAGGEGLAQRMLHTLSSQIARLTEPDSLARLEAVADRLTGARKIFVLGMRSCHSVAWHFHYVMTLFADKTVHLDGPGGTVGDGLIRAGAEDVLLVISLNPYVLRGLELTQAAREKGLGIVAITDSEVSPLAGLSDDVILCPADSLSFFHTLTPALAISEVLCGMLASRNSTAALEQLQRTDRHLLSLNTYANSIPRRKI